ncbi:helix-turn-helix domain-containing protein [Actinocorallia populi]|uniref:helix-turn-helix domain-containing protein n=1 Tax=Actinocorallia populi TaxID=2079200 RepID=UPI00130048B0|nr:helix-turn-helix transcriptional regulator [Actinocorallia populi]
MSASSTPSTSPAIRAYAGELTAWREEARLNKTELARLLGYTPAYIAQLEDCKNKPSQKFSEDCDTFFKINGIFVRLWRNIVDTRHLAILPPGFPEYLEREIQAATIRIYSGMLLHGLFQTPDIVKAIMSVVNDTETAAALTEKRLSRQTGVLNRENPPRIFLTVDEVLLRRVIGTAEMHRAQLEHLLALATRHNITVRVVPMDSGYYSGLTGSFTLFTFEDGTQAAYTESAGNGILMDNPARVADLGVEYELIQGHALRVNESLAMIRTVLEEP